MSYRMLGLVLAGAGIATGLGLAYWPGGGDGMLPYRHAAVTTLGRDIYADHCASCHGTVLEGEPDWRIAGGAGLVTDRWPGQRRCCAARPEFHAGGGR